MVSVRPTELSVITGSLECGCFGQVLHLDASVRVGKLVQDFLHLTQEHGEAGCLEGFDSASSVQCGRTNGALPSQSFFESRVRALLRA